MKRNNAQLTKRVHSLRTTGVAGTFKGHLSRIPIARFYLTGQKKEQLFFIYCHWKYYEKENW